MKPALRIIRRAAPMLLAFALTAGIAYAAGVPSGTGGGSFQNPTKYGTIEAFLAAILDVVIKIGAVIVVFMFVYVGFKFVVSRGDPKELETARRALLYACIGAVVLLGARMLQGVVKSTVDQFSR